MRRSLVLAATCAIVSVQVASAADMPTKAPAYAPVAPMVYSWTGFYVGADVGYGWGTSDSTATTGNVNFPVGFVFTPNDLTGAVAGGHAGYNYQIGQIVVGIEGDFDWTNLKGSASDFSILSGNTTTTTSKLTWLADITGRVGYAWDNWLLYAKGGGAWTHGEGSSITTGTGTTTSGSEDRSGWLIGGGVEWGFMQHWSAKAEYNYMDFGTTNVTRVSNTGVVNQRDNTLKVNVVKIGVSYHF
jgi:outer membrane immunogenic protein